MLPFEPGNQRVYTKLASLLSIWRTMESVEDFISDFSGNQKRVLMHLHNWLTNELNLVEKIRWGIPFYYGKSWICYLNPTKEGSVEFAFVRGNELSNEQGLLNSKGRKQVYSVEFSIMKDLPQQALNEIIQEAILLDATVPYAAKRKNG